MAIRTLGDALRQSLYVYAANTSLGWRVVRPIRFAQGERKVARGEMRRVLDTSGNHVGYQVLARPERHDEDLPSQPGPVTITKSQMELNAEGGSRTMGMPEAQRLERAARVNPHTGHHLQPEDAVERTMRKVQVYDRVGAAKGDILRVWPQGAVEPLGAGA